MIPPTPVVATLLSVASLGAYLTVQGWKDRSELTDVGQSRLVKSDEDYTGTGRVAGRVVSIDGQSFNSPVSGEPCVVSDYQVNRYDHKYQQWRHISDGREFISFYVDDGAGLIQVNPSGMNISVENGEEYSQRVTYRGETPSPIQKFLQRQESVDPSEPITPLIGAADPNPERLYKERIIQPGDTVHVYGYIKKQDHLTADEPRADCVMVEGSSGYLTDELGENPAKNFLSATPISLFVGPLLIAVTLTIAVVTLTL